MKYYWILTSEVTGGHTVKDIGLFIPYKGEARVHKDRANWSSDLSYALSQGLVRKVRVEKSRSGTIQLPPNLAKKQTKKQEPPKQTEKKKRPVSSEEVKKLEEMNEKLASKVDQLASEQKALMEAITNKQADNDQSELLSQILDAIKTRPVQQVSNSGGSSPAQQNSPTNNDDFVFVPKNIRRKDRKGSEDIEIVEESSSSSKMDEAAAALRKMKEKNNS